MFEFRRLRRTPPRIACLIGAAALSAPALVLGQAPGEHSAVLATDCDRSCLIETTRHYLDALVHKDRSRAPFASSVRVTENDVQIPLGERGLWKSATAVSSPGLELADVSSGNGAWFGTVQETDQLSFLTVRVRVAHRQIIEVETLVIRKGRLPTAFGDPEKLAHDAAFSEALTPVERRSRERLVAVANGYFSTVELNDGAVFTQFDPGCQRNENGISTTQGSFGAAGDAQGCEAQFKLGLYRINKRVRERRFPLVDEERGIVLATGFFDHANTFDTYVTNDGKSHRTLLKWPNSISLMEAFKIRNGLIYRIEATFTYVPYFMHSPWASAQQDSALQGRDAFATPSRAAGPRSSGRPAQCESSCLIALADGYVSSLANHDYSRLPWSDRVRFKENGVSMMIGDGLWGSVTSAGADPLHAADPQSGSVAWFGTVAEHGEPAYFGLRLKVESGRIADVETLVARKNDVDRFGNPETPPDGAAFAAGAAGARLSRRQLIALVDGYYDSAQQDARAGMSNRIDSGCVRTENGVAATPAANQTATPFSACMPAVTRGKHSAVTFRSRMYPVVDEARGIVVATGYLDVEPLRHEVSAPGADARAGGAVAYSRSEGFMDAFKVRGGKILRIESVATDVPYFMSSDWTQ